MKRSALTKIELLLVIGVIVLLLGILVPLNLRARETSNRVLCHNNLRAIGQAILLYSNDQRGGAFPRVRASAGPDRVPTWGTNPAVTQPFADDGPAENDVTAALFLLIRTQDVTSSVFICPSTNQVPDDYAGMTPIQRSNFTNLRRNLSYSYQNPYPDDPSLGRGWRLQSTPNAEMAFLADKNPAAMGNSNNHSKAGQNVLYGDGHVAWAPTPFAGDNRDNIYTTADGKIAASSYDGNDSILLPTDD